MKQAPTIIEKSSPNDGTKHDHSLDYCRGWDDACERIVEAAEELASSQAKSIASDAFQLAKAKDIIDWFASPDKLKNYLAENSKPLKGWEEFKGNILTPTTPGSYRVTEQDLLYPRDLADGLPWVVPKKWEWTGEEWLNRSGEVEETPPVSWEEIKQRTI
jgi:hypothetical protein